MLSLANSCMHLSETKCLSKKPMSLFAFFLQDAFPNRASGMAQWAGLTIPMF
uniref:Uncharacterized protein n=1 Tax=Rhizophora mucronata TaxID=61149 RepID=A0A2P2JJC2_RHIMU